MDVGIPSIQAYKAHEQEGTLVSKMHKQGALGTSSQASLHQWLQCMSNNQAIVFDFCNLELIHRSYNYDAATDVGMLGKMCLCPLFVHLAYQCSFCSCATDVGLCAGMISFEIFSPAWPTDSTVKERDWNTSLTPCCLKH